MSYHITDTNSSLISEIEYYEEEEELVIRFKKYWTDELTYVGVPLYYFIQFSEQKSLGQYYLRMIKTQFKLKPRIMAAEKPETVNQSSDEKRHIKISINVANIKKEWIYPGEKGNYLHITLSMLPDGELDAYGNLGMVTQDVPKAIYEKEKNLDKSKRTKGPILGNAAEFKRKGSEGAPGADGLKIAGDQIPDDLPF